MDVTGLRIRQLSELQQLLQQYPPFRQIELRQYWQRQIEEATDKGGMTGSEAIRFAMACPAAEELWCSRG